MQETSGSDFDYAAEMMHFKPNESNVIKQSNDEFNRSNADYIETSEKSRNTTLKEIQTHIREQHKMAKELKGMIQNKLYCQKLFNFNIYIVI